MKKNNYFNVHFNIELSLWNWVSGIFRSESKNPTTVLGYVVIALEMWFLSHFPNIASNASEINQIMCAKKSVWLQTSNKLSTRRLNVSVVTRLAVKFLMQLNVNVRQQFLELSIFAMKPIQFKFKSKPKYHANWHVDLEFWFGFGLILTCRFYVNLCDTRIQSHQNVWPCNVNIVLHLLLQQWTFHIIDCADSCGKCLKGDK